MTGQLAWVTGASTGIGRALALGLAARGWRVAASARPSAALDALAPEGTDIAAYPLDVRDAAANAATVAAIEATGPIALAILNAGTYRPSWAAGFDVATMRDMVETNLMGTVNGLIPVMERMMARRSGHIVLVASVAGWRGLPGGGAYGATKAALINLAESLKPDLERHGIALTVVAPGFVRTPLTAGNDFPMPFLIEADEAARIILDRLPGRPFSLALPWRMALAMGLLRLLPAPLLFGLTRRMLR
ncbi:MAG: SDR family NAD(P)-dependent oxidoreductase [Alphaproteobacteria bacterium]|jgi:NAD(P)-dependent dehydrogenase (short-subunit alcohol dehydrogenase family)|nr:SDR family NAD(P)-dependent oxidoreductase [Alphaproteobacteria bacterium]